MTPQDARNTINEEGYEAFLMRKLRNFQVFKQADQLTPGQQPQLEDLTARTYMNIISYNEAKGSEDLKEKAEVKQLKNARIKRPRLMTHLKKR